MSEKVNKLDDIDELSLLLDELNAGRKPECDDRELADLLAVAELIKSTSGPVRPPQHILDQTVDRALSGIAAGKPKPSRSWWFSGALGTAAAVMLVIGLNMLPSWRERAPIVPPPAAVAPQKDTLRAKPDTEQKTAGPQTTPATTAPAARQQPPTGEQPKINPPVAQAPPAESSKPPVAASEKSIMAEEMPRSSPSKSANLPEAAKAPISLAPLKLPGKVPDLVTADREKGTLRQVYFKGTPQEITITQRLQPPDAGNTQAKQPYPSVFKAAKSAPDTVNTVRVTIGDQEVTLEGRQSRQELLKLAESLTP